MKHDQIKSRKLGEKCAINVSKSDRYIPLLLMVGVCLPLLFSGEPQLRTLGAFLQILVACAALFWGYQKQKFSKRVWMLGSFVLAVSAFEIIGYTFLN